MLDEVPFMPEFGNSEFNPMQDDPTLPFEGHFNVPVPLAPGLARVEIWHEGQLLAARDGSPNPPIVQILRPMGGEQIGPGLFSVEWVSSDIDGDPHTYLVQYSRDGGNNWDTITSPSLRPARANSTDWSSDKER